MLSSNGDDLELSYLSHPKCVLEGEFCEREGSERDRETGLSHQESHRVHLSHLQPLLLPFHVPTPSRHLISSCLFSLSAFSLPLFLTLFSCSYSHAHTLCPFYHWLSPALTLFSPSDGGHKSLCCQRQSSLDYAMLLFNSFRAWREDPCETTIHPAHFPTSASPK